MGDSLENACLATASGEERRFQRMCLAAFAAHQRRADQVGFVYRDGRDRLDPSLGTNGGNNYRVIVHVGYRFKRVLVKFVGTHAEYDRIDPETVG